MKKVTKKWLMTLLSVVRYCHSIAPNGLRICEVRIEETLKLNTNLNSVFHIYAVSKS
jgi:hypothetical protein